MSETERQLLDNALDALDRLFDGKSGVIDLLALLYATAEALRATDHFREICGPVAVLEEIVRSGANYETQRDRALVETDELRHYLAGFFPYEGK